MRRIAASATAAMPSCSTLSAKSPEGRPAGFRERDGAADQHQALEPRAMPARQPERDEAAEAVAQDVGRGRQRQVVEQAGDPVRIVAERRARGGRAAKARQVHEDQPPLPSEPRGERLERGPIGQQRVQQDQIAALAHDLDIQPRAHSVALLSHTMGPIDGIFDLGGARLNAGTGQPES